MQANSIHLDCSFDLPGSHSSGNQSTLPRLATICSVVLQVGIGANRVGQRPKSLVSGDQQILDLSDARYHN